MRRPENRNLLLSRILVDELIRLGVAGVCISPGSRSTSLAIAVAERGELKRYLLLDERSAAYFALGLAQATRLPAVLICTSGTAAANYLPALVEAGQAGVPLLAITADRPAGLRGSGANQTIDQVKLYGDVVRWYAEIPAPGAEFTAGRVRELRTVVDRLYGAASGQRPGPVHLNIQFEKPLEPTPGTPLVEDSSDDYSRLVEGSWGPGPYSEQVLGQAHVLPSTSDALQQLVQRRRGMIVCGPRCQGGDFPSAVTELGKALGYPILADVLSGVRVHPHADRDTTFGLYENYAGGMWLLPDLIIQFGGMPVSTRLQEYLGRASDAPRIHVSADGAWADDRSLVTRRIIADPSETCRRWAQDLFSAGMPPDAAWMGMWAAQERLAEAVIAENCALESFEGAWVRELVESAPDGSVVFLGNSLPVRHADEFVPVQSRRLEFFANRGASGIDGTLSTALGLAAGRRGGGVLAILGDLALLHDLNALMVFKRYALPVKLVVINNDGGGLFLRLPVAQFEPPFTELFHTPHGLQFGDAARLFGLAYARITSDSRARTGLESALNTGGPVLIEIESDARAHDLARTRIQQQIATRSRDARLPENHAQEN